MSAIATEISTRVCDAEGAAARGDGETVGTGAVCARVPLVVQTPGGLVTLLTRDAQQALLLRVRLRSRAQRREAQTPPARTRRAS